MLYHLAATRITPLEPGYKIRGRKAVVNICIYFFAGGDKEEQNFFSKLFTMPRTITIAGGLLKGFDAYLWVHILHRIACEVKAAEAFDFGGSGEDFFVAEDPDLPCFWCDILERISWTLTDHFSMAAGLKRGLNCTTLL